MHCTDVIAFIALTTQTRWLLKSATGPSKNGHWSYCLIIKQRAISHWPKCLSTSLAVGCKMEKPANSRGKISQKRCRFSDERCSCECRITRREHFWQSAIG